MANAKKTQNNETDFPPMKKGGYQETFDKQMENENKELFAEEVLKFVNGKDYDFFLDSIYFEAWESMFLDVVESIKSDFLEEKSKNKKKFTKSELSDIKSLAIHFVFMMIDDLKKGDERLETIKNVTNDYFDGNKLHFTLGLGFAFLQIELSDEINRFVPKMNFEKAYDKMLKWYVKPEATDYQVPQEVKFRIGMVKQHIDVYMWEEFLKQEYYALKLTGMEDASIIDMFNSEAMIFKFCKWCSGYVENVDESEIQLHK